MLRGRAKQPRGVTFATPMIELPKNLRITFERRHFHETN
jgi:hypothetical protein